MRRPVIAGNWKMNLTFDEAMALSDTIAAGLIDSQKTQVILAPPFLYLDEINQRLQESSHIFIAAQNCSEKISGAYTGEISAQMLASIGIEYVIIGHSERRQYFGETDDSVNLRLKAALEAGLIPICCVGEVLQELLFAGVETCRIERPSRFGYAPGS